ncbi:MAG: hypothetical protein EXR61_05495 [Chloroflexi bacterium]|nr:hypothetical protein [Chloroflexota bacterium]
MRGRNAATMYAHDDAHIRVLFEMTGEMLCVADMDGRVLLLNPDDVEPSRMAFGGLRAGLTLRGHIARFEHRDGSSRWLTGKPSRTANSSMRSPAM